MKEEELKIFAKLVRRMFTGLFDDVNELFEGTDEEFLKKLDGAKEQNVYCDWTLREYTTNKWFYNALTASNKYQEVIFSSEHGSLLQTVSECTFPQYNRGSKSGHYQLL